MHVFFVFCGAFSKGPRGKCTFSAELSVRDRGESARFLCFFAIAHWAVFL